MALQCSLDHHESPARQLNDQIDDAHDEWTVLDVLRLQPLHALIQIANGQAHLLFHHGVRRSSHQPIRIGLFDFNQGASMVAVGRVIHLWILVCATACGGWLS